MPIVPIETKLDLAVAVGHGQRLRIDERGRLVGASLSHEQHVRLGDCFRCLSARGRARIQHRRHLLQEKIFTILEAEKNGWKVENMYNNKYIERMSSTRNISGSLYAMLTTDKVVYLTRFLETAVARRLKPIDREAMREDLNREIAARAQQERLALRKAAKEAAIKAKLPPQGMVRLLPPPDQIHFDDDGTPELPPGAVWTPMEQVHAQLYQRGMLFAKEGSGADLGSSPVIDKFKKFKALFKKSATPKEGRLRDRSDSSGSSGSEGAKAGPSVPPTPRPGRETGAIPKQPSASRAELRARVMEQRTRVEESPKKKKKGFAALGQKLSISSLRDALSSKKKKGPDERTPLLTRPGRREAPEPDESRQQRYQPRGYSGGEYSLTSEERLLRGRYQKKNSNGDESWL